MAKDVMAVPSRHDFAQKLKSHANADQAEPKVIDIALAGTPSATQSTTNNCRIFSTSERGENLAPAPAEQIHAMQK